MEQFAEEKDGEEAEQDSEAQIEGDQQPAASKKCAFYDAFDVNRDLRES